MRLPQLLLITFLVSLLIVGTQSSWSREYVVKSGDTLSEIARGQIGRQVYGPNGSLLLLLRWNPNLNKLNPKYLQAKTVLNLEEPLKEEKKSDPEIVVPQVEANKVSTVEAPLENRVDAIQLAKTESLTQDTEIPFWQGPKEMGISIDLGASKLEGTSLGTNATAKLVSLSSFSTHAYLRWGIFQHSGLELSIGTGTLRFLEPNGAVLLTKSTDQFDLGLGYIRYFSNASWASLGIFRTRVPTILGSGTGALSVANTDVFGMALSSESGLFRLFNFFDCGLLGTLLYTFPTENVGIRLLSNWKFSMTGFGEHEIFPSWTLRASGELTYQIQNTSEASQNQLNLVGKLTVKYLF